MNDLNPKVYYMIHYYRGKVKKLCLGADFKLSHIELQFHTQKKKKKKKKSLHTCLEQIIPSCKLR